MSKPLCNPASSQQETVNHQATPRSYAVQQPRPWQWHVLIALTILLVIAFLSAVAIGPLLLHPLSLLQVLAFRLGIVSEVDPTAQAVLELIRMPRAVAAILVGGTLAVSGAAMQGMFRNPLADPGLIGISAGAGLAATIAIVLGGWMLGSYWLAWSQWIISGAAFSGALISTLVVTTIGRVRGQTVVATMLLAGIAIGSIAGAGIGYLTVLADDQQLRDLTFWSMGSLGGITWTRLMIAGPAMIVAMMLVVRWGRELNALVLGEVAAGHLGVRVERLKRRLIVLVALGVGLAVAISGSIGFVGLVVPHLLRLAVGPDHRFLLPASFLAGATLLLGADLAARTVAAPAEMPIGVLTATIGGPFFLYLLLRGRSKSTGAAL